MSENKTDQIKEDKRECDEQVQRLVTRKRKAEDGIGKKEVKVVHVPDETMEHFLTSKIENLQKYVAGIPTLALNKRFSAVINDLKVDGLIEWIVWMDASGVNFTEGLKSLYSELGLKTSELEEAHITRLRLYFEMFHNIILKN